MVCGDFLVWLRWCWLARFGFLPLLLVVLGSLLLDWLFSVFLLVVGLLYWRLPYLPINSVGQIGFVLWVGFDGAMFGLFALLIIIIARLFGYWYCCVCLCSDGLV